MLVRSKQRERGASWRRRVRNGHAVDHPGHPVGAEPEGSPRERRQGGGPSEDRALYTCECGYAFEALVTTSVDCPHCDRTQAW